MRWLIQRAILREPRFGETRRDVLGWTVQPYVELGDGSRQFFNDPVPFPTLAAAHRYARSECDRVATAAKRKAIAAGRIAA
ncbi:MULTISPECIES: hypothetical protein [Microbacterium]|uniref:hypothetical protein n=1 Tax=Microbacterium TaxID=33882 RepID=UPI00168B470E|nr:MULTISPECIES: hypothetical protein [Microbacterium]QOC24814.1 hypothetical protein IC745_10505 [Microbacterium hominis]QYF98930.1 hypothetical protein KY498_06870 [Microbacterium sp. PAMC21962]